MARTQIARIGGRGAWAQRQERARRAANAAGWKPETIVRRWRRTKHKARSVSASYRQARAVSGTTGTMLLLIKFSDEQVERSIPNGDGPDDGLIRRWETILKGRIPAGENVRTMPSPFAIRRQRNNLIAAFEAKMLDADNDVWRDFKRVEKEAQAIIQRGSAEGATSGQLRAAADALADLQRARRVRDDALDASKKAVHRYRESGVDADMQEWMTEQRRRVQAAIKKKLDALQAGLLDEVIDGVGDFNGGEVKKILAPKMQAPDVDAEFEEVGEDDDPED